MKLNPKNILFGDDKEKKGPVLLAVTPPRAGGAHPAGRGEPPPVHRGARTILTGAGRGRGRRDFDGPLPGRPGGAGPALGPLPPGTHPEGGAGGRSPAPRRGRAGVVDHAAGRRPRVRPPEDLQGRRPARPRFGPPHRPDGRSVGPPREGARGGASAAALPRSRLVAAPHGEGPQAARHGAEGARLHLPDQAPADGRRDDGRPRPGRACRPQGIPVGAGRRDMEGRAPGDGHGPGAGRGRLGMVALEEGPQAGGRPPAHQGEGLPHSLRRRASGRRRRACGRRAAAGQGASGNGGPPPTATTTTPQGRGSRWGR